MKRSLLAALVLVLALPFASEASGRQLFRIDAEILGMPMGSSVREEDDSMLDLIEDFVEGAGEFAGLPPIAALLPYQGRLNYLGVPNALIVDVQNLPGSSTALLRIPSTGTVVPFAAANPDDLFEQIEDWFEKDGVDQWADFLRASNGLSPLAVISGNPKSSVALMGDSAYRKFGYDDSRSRFGFGEKKIQRVGGFQFRIDASAASVNTQNFDDDLVTIDGALTFAGDFGRYIGLSFSIIGQYRDYNGSKIGDLGLELALPLTFLRPDTSQYFWQLTPFFQAAGAASVDAAAGGIFLGGGLTNVIGFHRSNWDIQMSNQIGYYGGIPVDDILGFDFDTKLKQWFFKNGLEGSVWWGKGFYSDLGVHFSNFAKDRAAVSWYATPTVGVGWQAGRWMDIRLAYEPDVGKNDYRAHNAVLKLDFLF